MLNRNSLVHPLEVALPATELHRLLEWRRRSVVHAFLVAFFQAETSPADGVPPFRTPLCSTADQKISTKRVVMKPVLYWTWQIGHKCVMGDQFFGRSIRLPGSAGLSLFRPRAVSAFHMFREVNVFLKPHMKLSNAFWMSSRFYVGDWPCPALFPAPIAQLCQRQLFTYLTCTGVKPLRLANPT